jgi:hypothetical protein
MPSPFKALEARVNSAVLSRLANADATAVTQYGELVGFSVIFDNGYADLISGLAEGTQPSCQARSADVSGLVHGSSVFIGSDEWRVVGVEPDGTGMSTLRLRAP